jgi:hypothetical protein
MHEFAIINDRGSQFAVDIKLHINIFDNLHLREGNLIVLLNIRKIPLRIIEHIITTMYT